MGFETAEEKTPSAGYRQHFPVTERFIYLNHAGVAPLCRPARDAMAALADDVWNYGSFHYGQWMAAYDGLRASTARLINSQPGEIAIVKNTSEGIATVALGLDWRPGDRVVCFTEEFPANLLPWLRLSSRGVHVERLSFRASLDEIDAAARGARLLAISFVQFLSGWRTALAAIGEICRRRNCFFFVDAIQGLGAFPLDVEAAGIDALAADGHKWLLGPEGCGILFVRESRLPEIEPAEFGWTNIVGFDDYRPKERVELRPDAGRYECGTLNTIGCFGLRASIDFLLEVGIAEVALRVQSLADRLAEGAGRKGYELAAPRTVEAGAGIVSIRKPGVDPAAAVYHLKQNAVLAAPRAGWIRLSPHFYLTLEEMDRTVELLP